MRNVLTVLAVLALGGPAAAQEKEFVFDRDTGRVTQKDAEQDKEIAALKKEVAALKAKLAPATAATAPGVAVVSPFGPTAEGCVEGCPCPLTAGTPAPAAVTRPATPTYSSAPVRYEGLTYTAVPSAGSGGITSGGCANGSCAAPARVGLFRRFR